MKKMGKRILASSMMLALALSMSATAFADECKPSDCKPSDDYDSSVVSLIKPKYKITVPEIISLQEQVNGEYSQTAEIKAENVRLKRNQKLNVSIIAGKDGFILTEQSDSDVKLAYKVKSLDGEEYKSKDTVASFNTSQSAQVKRLVFTSETPTYAGDYSDTVTFNVFVSSQD